MLLPVFAEVDDVVEVFDVKTLSSVNAEACSSDDGVQTFALNVELLDCRIWSLLGTGACLDKDSKSVVRFFISGYTSCELTRGS